MEGLIEALNRARSFGRPEMQVRDESRLDRLWADQQTGDPFADASVRAKSLSPLHLKNERIVAFDAKDPQTRGFDVLRNGLMASVGADCSAIVAVGAPTQGCGASVIAANLAFSIARKRDRQVLLLSLGEVSKRFRRIGLSPQDAASREFAGLQIEKVKADGSAIHIGRFGQLAAVSLDPDSRHMLTVDWLSRAVRSFGPAVFVVDLPPLLTSDEAVTVAEHADAVLLVLAVGKSTVAELEACRSSLAATPHHTLLNKARRHGL